MKSLEKFVRKGVDMYGVIITSRPTCQVAETIDHVDCIPTYDKAKN